jgi:putative redox protein
MTSVTVSSLPTHRYAVQVEADEHAWLADEPPANGGDDLGPDPVELLLSALGACTTITLRMYAERKQWPLEYISIDLIHQRLSGEGADPAAREDIIHLNLRFEGNLDATQRARLIEIAARCPVHRILTNQPRMILTDLSGS